MRCLAQPANSTPLELLANRVASVYEQIEPFERPPSYFGVRFQFQPAILVPRSESEGSEEPEDSTAIETVDESDEEGPERPVEMPGHITLRLETYARDPSQVWMEAKAFYPQAVRPIFLTDLDRIAANIRHTYNFLTSNCKRFLDQYDFPGEND